MQVRVDGDQPIEVLGNKGADDGLADHLAGVEGDVLAHIGQVGRHQQQALHAEGAGLAGHQQQLDQFVVGAVEAAVQQHLARYGLAGAERQAQAQLVIGETVPLDGRGRQAQGLGQAQGRGLFVGEIQQQGTHQHSTNNGARLSALPMLKPSARAQAWRANSRSAG